MGHVSILNLHFCAECNTVQSRSHIKHDVRNSCPLALKARKRRVERRTTSAARSLLRGISDNLPSYRSCPFADIEMTAVQAINRLIAYAAYYRIEGVWQSRLIEYELFDALHITVPAFLFRSCGRATLPAA